MKGLALLMGVRWGWGRVALGRERGAEVKTRVPESRRLWGAQPVIVRKGAFVGQTDRWHSKPGRKKGGKKKKRPRRRAGVASAAAATTTIKPAARLRPAPGE